MCQFYSDSSRFFFFCNNCTSFILNRGITTLRYLYRVGHRIRARQKSRFLEILYVLGTQLIIDDKVYRVRLLKLYI
jgi:hypothetical protein